jgi:hypothetical protein
MKPLPLALLLSSFASPTFAETAAESAAPGSSRNVFNGSPEMVVCVSEPRLKIRGGDLLSVLFTVPNHSPVKVFQGWGSNKKTKNIDGKRVAFVKVQLPNQAERIGWVAANLVRARSLCEEAQPVLSGKGMEGASVACAR